MLGWWTSSMDRAESAGFTPGGRASALFYDIHRKIVAPPMLPLSPPLYILR
jgi:hypothetical protein